MDINLFKFSPKELTTDAFINYLFLWAQDHNELQSISQQLLLLNEDKNKIVSDLKVKRQVSFGRKKADIVVDFKLDGESKSVLFENKTNTHSSVKQLMSYKQGKLKYKYNYLKLGYINQSEKEICEKCGYDIISSSDLFESIDTIKCPDEIIKQYKSYLTDNFIKPLNQIEASYRDNSIITMLNNQDAQMYLCEKIYENLQSHHSNNKSLSKLDQLRIQFGSNTGGNPWSEIVFLEEEKHPDTLFWRIDKRSGKYYIRLNQYSNSKDASSEEKKLKRNRLLKLRDFSKEYFDKIPELKQGKLINGDYNEREILIFFFEENEDLQVLLRHIEAFTFDIKMNYLKIINYE